MDKHDELTEVEGLKLHVIALRAHMRAIEAQKALAEAAQHAAQQDLVEAVIDGDRYRAAWEAISVTLRYRNSDISSRDLTILDLKATIQHMKKPMPPGQPTTWRRIKGWFRHGD